MAFIDKIKEIAGMLVIDQICNTIDVFYTEKIHQGCAGLDFMLL